MSTSSRAVEGVRERFTGEPTEVARIFSDAHSTIDSYAAGMQDTQLAFAVKDVSQSVECRVGLMPEQSLSEQRLWLGAQEHDLGNRLIVLGSELESASVLLEAARHYLSSVRQARLFMQEHVENLQPEQTRWIVGLFTGSAGRFLEARELVAQVGDAPDHMTDLTLPVNQVDEERLAVSRLVNRAEGSGSAAAGTPDALEDLERSVAVLRQRGSQEVR